MADELKLLKKLVRVGRVSSVDTGAGTARVHFQDKGDGYVSGPLKIVQRPPAVTVEPTTLTYGVLTADGHTHAGVTEDHAHDATAGNWFPAVGEMVLCLYLPVEDGDGFVLGGV